MARAFLALLVCCGALNAQSGPEIARKVAARYKSLDGYRIQGVCEIYDGGLGEGFRFVIEGARKSDKVRAECRMRPFTVIYIYNGETMWTYAPERKAYTRFDATASGEDKDDQSGLDDLYARAVYQNAVLHFAALDKAADHARLVGEKELKTRNGKVRCWILETNAQGRPEKDWVDEQRLLVLRWELEAPASPVSRHAVVTIKDFDLEMPGPDRFAFQPDEAAKQVEDLGLPGENASFAGRRAPDFFLPDVDGHALRLSDLRGKIVVLDFWSMLSAPSVRELPIIERLSAELKSQGVVFVGLNDESPGPVQSFIRSNHYTFRTLEDANRQVHGAYHTNAVPNVFVISRKGMIVRRLVGARDERTLLAAIQEAGRQ